MPKFIAFVLYVVVFVPVSLFRQLTQSSAYGNKAYEAASGWDQPTNNSQN